MGKVIQSPIPYELDYSKDWKEWEVYDKEYIQKVRDTLKKSDDPYVGKVFGIPHADGQAQYMVKNLKPLQLIHLPIGDAWEAPYVNRLTASDIKKEVDRSDKIAEIFAKHAKSA